MTVRTCPGCGYRFTAQPGAVYCSSLCESGPAAAQVLDALRRFAGAQAAALASAQDGAPGPPAASGG
jgi:hypothetical protein